MVEFKKWMFQKLKLNKMKLSLFFLTLFINSMCFSQKANESRWLEVKFINFWNMSDSSHQKELLRDYVYDFAKYKETQNKIPYLCQRSRSKSFFKISEIVDVTTFFVNYFVLTPKNDSLEFCVLKFLLQNKHLLTFDQKSQIYDWIDVTYLDKRNVNYKKLSNIEYGRLFSFIYLFFDNKSFYRAKLKIEQENSNLNFDSTNFLISDTCIFSKCQCQ
jgi:hypothetical protein